MSVDSYVAPSADNSANSALIIVDVQNDFCAGGSLATERGADIAAQISSFLASGGAKNYRFILGTKDWHIDPGTHFAPEGSSPDFIDSWPVHCVAQTKGAESHPALDTSYVDMWFHKGEYDAAYSGFEAHSVGGHSIEGEASSPQSASSDCPESLELGDSGGLLGTWLGKNGITHVDICGIATDFCVRATALDAKAQGLSTRVLVDLCAPVSDEGERKTQQEFRDQGIILESSGELRY